jgi:hypothetical protein
MENGMIDHRQLTLEYAREMFRKRSNSLSAHYYLQVLMRYRHMDKIDDEAYLDGMDEIKEWMKGVRR